MPTQHPDPADRMIDYAGQILLLAKRLEKEGPMPDTLRDLRTIARDLKRCSEIWQDVYHPGMLPVVVPPAVPYLPRRGLAMFAAEEPPRVAQFWKAYEALSAALGGDVVEPLNHSHDATCIAINFSQLYEVWADSDLPIVEKDALQADLKKSVRRPLLARNLSLSSRLTGKSTRCWLFEKS
ncbi:MAG: hypothetical protein LBU75_07160 [Desulfovibrio sp.]|nr:hypothetical protein [Desulfovibrio sp.]